MCAVARQMARLWVSLIMAMNAGLSLSACAPPPQHTQLHKPTVVYSRAKPAASGPKQTQTLCVASGTELSDARKREIFQQFTETHSASLALFDTTHDQAGSAINSPEAAGPCTPLH